ncbi:MAG: arginine--tRNA ligase [Candidatus Babeliales bacterium]
MKHALESLKHSFFDHLVKIFPDARENLHAITLDINTDEHKQAFGDITSNAALILGKALGKNPREVATSLAQQFKSTQVKNIEIAGPGFLNFFLEHATFVELTCNLFKEPREFFVPDDITKHRYSVEFVSANPTGPLHLGHGRGGIIGDVLSNVLTFIGHTVTKEYYINDAGSQIQKLGTSFKVRYLQELGIEAELPEEGYRGDYLIDLAKKCIKEHGKKVAEKPDTFFEQYAKEHMLEQIKETLKEYGITFDLWFSEKNIA